MSRTERRVIGGIVVMLMGAISVWAFSRVPEVMVTHWGPAGPDGTMDRTVALVGLPVLAAGLFGLFELLPRIDPLGENLRELGRYYDVLVVGVVGLVGYVHLLVVLWNVGYEFDVLQAIAPAVALLFYVIGVILERVEKNWFLGVRTPWTLSSEAVWDRTHEYAAPLFKLSGLLALLAVLVPEYAEYLLVGPVVLSAIILSAYSYLLYDRLEGDADDNA